VCKTHKRSGSEEIAIIIDENQNAQTQTDNSRRALMEEFLRPLGIRQYRLAKEIGVPAQRIGQIVKSKRVITADTDLQLCRFFGLSNGYWLRAQSAHDTEIAERMLGTKILQIKPWAA
jgi:antitoxin HigA-1